MRAPTLTRVRDHLRSNIIGWLALFLVLTGGMAWANHPGGADTISSGDIINNEVKSVDLANGEVKTDDLAANSVGSGKIADQSVKNADLSIGASSSNTIADGGIQGIDVKNNTLTGTQVDESTLFNDNSLVGADIDESTLFNDDSLTGTDIDESTLAGVPSAPSGPAGGDLAGTYPNPDIADAAVTIPKLAFDPATQAELDDHASSAAHDLRYWKLDGNSAVEPGQFLGTTDNSPLNLHVNNARGLRLEPASDGTNESPNVIGGIADNSVSPGVHSATIAGGGRLAPAASTTANKVTDNYGTVGGGADNRAGDAAGTVSDRQWATVGGGVGNAASGAKAAVGGGQSNTASASNTTIGGGFTNSASAPQATVGGGLENTASGFQAAVPGGRLNTAAGNNSLAAGTRARANHNGAFVWADMNPFEFASTAENQFNVRSTGGARLVSGIDGTTGSPTSGLELLAGTSGWSTLVNGQPFDIRVNNSRGLRIEPASDGTNQSPNVIGGIADNSVTAGVHSATIGGGGRSSPDDPASANRVTDNYGTVGGGAGNRAGSADDDHNDALVATVGGGFSNTAGGAGATVSGGARNEALEAWATVGGGNENFASGFAATTAGGQLNDAIGGAATVGGGVGNAASGSWATVPGGSSNTAVGDNSLAAGRRAWANHDGAFVWADSNDFNFFSTAVDEFSVRSTGGARFVSAIDSFTGDPIAGVELAPGGGSWSSLSDAASKRAVEPVSGLEVLRDLSSVPISTWSYRSQDDSIRHIGPMAQDFFRAFGVGEDRRHISSVDADGVALAAIKALNRKVERLQRELAALRR